MKFILSLFLLMSTYCCMYGQDLIYTPKNSAFGGNALNYSWLLNSANAQNTTSAPSSTGDFDDFSTDPLTEFSEGLNRQVLSQIAQQVFDQQFGENNILEAGSFEFGDLQVQVSPGANGLVITITDFSTGGQSQITVPYF